MRSRLPLGYRSKFNQIKLFCDTAPMFVELCQWTQQHLKDDDKLLIVDNVPLVAWLWKITSQSLFIEITTMHLGLDQRSRTKIVNDFNRKGSLKVLTIMYGGQAINLQKQWLPDVLIGRRTQIDARSRRRDRQSRLEGLHHCP